MNITVPIKPRADAAKIGGRFRDMVLERSPDVLWSLSPSGIVLHHVRRGAYLELDQSGYRLWAYLDGARTVAEAARASARTEAEAGAGRLLDVAKSLFVNGFVVERTP